MDTIVRGLPIPIIFIREQIDPNTYEPTRQVVDGQQRIRTVLSYIDPKSLKNYKQSRDYFKVKKIHNEELGGKDFEQLRRELKDRILDYQFSVHVLPSSVDDKQVLQIFARMNATGVKLRAQELRNATFFGEFKQTAYNLAYEQLARWRNWGIFTEDDIARMNEVEMTSDFLLLILKGISTKSKSSLDKVYKDKDCENCFPEKPIVEDRFRNVMDSIDDTLGEDLINLDFRKGTLFYYIFALIYDVHYGLGSELEKIRKRRIPSHFTKCIQSFELSGAKDLSEKTRKEATRRTSAEVRRTVFNYLKRKCISG